MAKRQAAFNKAVDGMSAPAIPTVLSWASRYEGSLGPLIDLSQAVPGYPPHPSLLEDIAQLAGERSLAVYGEIEGERILREAFAHYQSHQLDASVSPDNVHITAGCNQAFIVAMLALATVGDRVLLTNPYFFNNEAGLTMLGLEPRFVECSAERAFVPDALDIALAIDFHDARVVALISPNNPTGAVYSASALADIQTVCRERGVWLVLDETYADFIGDTGSPRHRLLSADEWEDNTVLLYSFSKVYCTPGLRVGAITAGTKAIAQMTKVMDNLQICAPRHAQVALAHALPALADWRRENMVEISRRAKAFSSQITAAPGWSIASMGAYFAYVKHPFSGVSSMEVAERLVRDAGVLCLPGTFFGKGQEDYLRIAFANVDVGEIEMLGERLRGL